MKHFFNLRCEANLSDHDSGMVEYFSKTFDIPIEKLIPLFIEIDFIREV